MNTKKHMIIIKGEIKTKNISSCRYNSNSKKWDVIFIGSGKVFSYAYSSIEWLKDPEILNPNSYRIGREGKEFFDVQAICVFRGNGMEYWHICFGNGSERDYRRDELNISKSCLIDDKSKNVFEYLKQISKLNNLRNKETDEKILEKRYEKILHVDEKTSLAKYLNPANEDSIMEKETIPIFPFGCNKSQYKAVKNALENQVSVIQGPPGTGKTQTILNIISNILLQGKTVQVVSNNNAAIENVYEKLSSSKYNLGFIVASLGNVENKKEFIRNQERTYPQFSDWMIQDTMLNSLDEVKSKSEQLSVVFDRQERLACLKQELAQLELEQKYFDEYLNETNVNIDSLKISKKISSEKLMWLWQKSQDFSTKHKKLGLLFKLKSIVMYGIRDWEFYRQDISKIITSFQGLFLKYKKKEIIRDINDIAESLDKFNAGLLEDMCNQSMIILKDALARRYSEKEERVIFSEDDLWKDPQRVLAEYPVILSTTFSSRTSLNSDVVYDYLIMDEASQVDVATGALSLSSAKNSVIVGDVKQLPNVVEEEIKKQSEAIFKDFNISKGYQFTNSFLQSVLDVIPDVRQVLLREHYRCHPKIINFCNQKFYRGELIIMTDDNSEENVLVAMKTVKGNHEREHYSQRQIDVIMEEVLPSLQTELSKISIITPYRNQVEAIDKQLEEIDVATVHKFQGREKDVIIISTVDDKISDFADDPYLLNVAVSRAKKKLVVVVSGNEQSPEKNISDLVAYIKYNNFEVRDSKIYSIFDYLYKQYTVARQKYLSTHKQISEYDSENLMYALISDILSANIYTSLDVVCHFPLNMLIRNPDLLNDRECEYTMNPATHLDFLIYNRLSKRSVLAVEVDGYDFHKEGTVQAERDQLKDRILNLYNIPILRFSTNGSGEKEIIELKLEELM
ncbi:AAA domain-containing protein [Sedimentibacter sp.]|uniref:AAA domain-containing protein n=1 Tax=Sedimentibacter sp. TaxID=1960295 RepID=UPI00289EE4F3|nr:AAA domain-containing protein [Sedimentibacter sp.]